MALADTVNKLTTRKIELLRTLNAAFTGLISLRPTIAKIIFLVRMYIQGNRSGKTPPHRGEECIYTNIVNCMEGLNAVSSQSYVKNYNATELLAYCSAVDRFSECISTFVDSCPAENQAQLNDMVNSDRYLCSEEGSALMVQNHECFRQVETETLMRNCTRLYFEQLNREDLDDEEWCALMNDGIRCSLTGMTEACGADAGRMIHAVQLNAYENSAALYSCTLVEETATGTENAAVHSHHWSFFTIFLTAISLKIALQFQLL
ncbi:hypothetical protein CAPTEDRAFT_226566 [Capitella teleta]|uniref:DUF19 domain-containing protein n=1 Tax=Capitella teleta TaxID=283909 RepID=R7T481_CAPTE|nr:hypothetical protein CAPTEDRAFT_226566 [Capitella teleta]|eukprot:ELT87581.1 hypothetical protein CAPTEDRAFT_226566 [Capitella teleta]